MLPKLTLDEDLEIKRVAATPSDQRPRFDWGMLLVEEPVRPLELKVSVGGEEEDFDVAEVADTIGGALTNLLLSRQVDPAEIFSERNRSFVARVSRSVVDALVDGGNGGGGDGEFRLTARDIHLAIERALIQSNAHDVARSLVAQRSRFLASKATAVPLQTRLIRRNGQVVPWSESKIEIAVRKAFLSLERDSDPAVHIARAVTERTRGLNKAFIHIEEVQDLVQGELMKAEHFKVAESYILYRASRADRRALALAERIPDISQDQMITVRREDGLPYLWDGRDLRARIEFARIGLDLCLSDAQIETELRRSLFADMTEADLRKTIQLNAKSLLEKDADFARFTGRILLSYIYEEVLGWDILRDGLTQLKSAHLRMFRSYLEHGIRIKRLAPDLLQYDIDRLAEAIDPSADLDFDYLGIQTLYDRYLIVDKQSGDFRRIETPQFFFLRVAMGLFLHESPNREEWAIALYRMYKSRRFCSSTPTLFNSGTLHSQLSSCYLYKVDDSIESIMVRGIAENAFLSKWAGGLGGSWTAVRGTGSYIQGTNGESQGVIPFLKLHNDQLVAVNQGGKRRGSGCAYLETWHNDIFDFLELRRNTGDDRRRTHDMNTACWVPDLFMKRMEARKSWTLFRSSETPDLHDLYGQAFEDRYQDYERRAEAGEIFGRSVPAIELWKTMLRMLFETGHPWITFKDACNIRSPQDHAGVIHSSNLCTEITLNTSAEETAVCNLGSIVLETHLGPNGELDLPKLRETVRIAVRALDNVIDINFYPTEAARRSNVRHRPVGLGVMGLQNALYKRRISFASEEAVEFNDEFMEAIAYFAYEASSDLAMERGAYPSFPGSKWDRGVLPQDTLDRLEQERGIAVDVPRAGWLDWTPLRRKIQAQGMRNSNVLAIAPTATISNIMGTAPCIEPTYRNLFVKSNLSGDFIVLNGSLVRELKAIGRWDQQMLDNLKYFDGELDAIPEIPDAIRSTYRTAFAVPYDFLIRSAARRQKWMDQSQSVNLFLAHADLKTLSHMYRAAWRQGLKTTYYLRTLGASNIEKATVSVKKEKRGRVAETDTVSATACRLDAIVNGGECEACQ